MPLAAAGKAVRAAKIVVRKILRWTRRCPGPVIRDLEGPGAARCHRQPARSTSLSLQASASKRCCALEQSHKSTTATATMIPFHAPRRQESATKSMGTRNHATNVWLREDHRRADAMPLAAAGKAVGAAKIVVRKILRWTRRCTGFRVVRSLRTPASPVNHDLERPRATPCHRQPARNTSLSLQASASKRCHHCKNLMTDFGPNARRARTFMWRKRKPRKNV